MKTKFLDVTKTYDGRQLRPLFAYLEHGVLGDSAVAWIGPCDIPFAHMIDGEDVAAGAQIRGGKMLHLILEIFDRDLFSGVALQRMIAALAKDLLAEKGVTGLRRDGDDLFLGERKLSISIASRSATSVMVHFALNVTNQNTPVPTCALEDDFKTDPRSFGAELLGRIAAEYESMVTATRKVRSL